MRAPLTPLARGQTPGLGPRSAESTVDENPHSNLIAPLNSVCFLSSLLFRLLLIL